MIRRLINTFINSQSYIFLLVFVVSACRVGQQFKRPEVKLPESFSQQVAGDTISVADLEWKKFFNDPGLQQLIERGVSYNYDLMLAVKRLEISQQQVKQAKLGQFPELDLLIAGQYNHPSKNSLNGKSANSFLGMSHIENYLTMVNLSWEVDVWGRIRGQKEAALAAYLESYEARKAVQTELVSSIAQGYFNLLMLDKQLEIAKKNLVLRDSFLVSTRLLRDAGVVNTLAVQQAESQRQTTALLVPELEQNIAIQENALQVLTGQLPGKLYRQGALQNLAFTNDLSAGMPAALLSRRPDVRAKEMSLVAANAQVGVAKANMFPALNITAGAGLESFQSSNWFSIPNSLFGLAAGSIAQPIFRRRALKTEFEIAKLHREEAVIEFRQSVLQATSEVENALVQIEKLKEQEQIASDQVDTLQRAIVNAQMLFRSDMANYLEVLNAQGSALLAELNLASVQRQQLSAKVELYRSLGGGWK
jgi:NodT family efflux transporter outer membrane factor (OMF) lipoprotein